MAAFTRLRFETSAGVITWDMPVALPPVTAKLTEASLLELIRPTFALLAFGLSDPRLSMLITAKLLAALDKISEEVTKAAT